MILVLGGCTGTAAQATLPVQLLARDGAIREIGRYCSGTGGFEAAHAKAPFQLFDASGKQVGSGELPDGRAIRAVDEDLGVSRVPTFCQWDFSVAVPQDAVGQAYTLRLDSGEPIDLRRNANGGTEAPAAGIMR
ncbi:hypothetical protein D5S17_20650 [Pseudonocardiaceae bacterium YIM PH 21723]|nr:hypothetical protein D5S17_20650 [Pseudonocardiaceae bacterium YIM PH 21723]